jgi:hypothetical protein
LCLTLPPAPSSPAEDLAAGLEWVYLQQPKRLCRAGLTNVCVTKMKSTFLYSKYKLIFNALFSKYSASPGISNHFPTPIENPWFKGLLSFLLFLPPNSRHTSYVLSHF